MGQDRLRIGNGRLAVERQRIVNGGRHSSGVKAGLNAVAVGHSDRVLRPGAGIVLGNCWRNDVHRTKGSIIGSSQQLACGNLVIQDIQLRQQDRRLQGVETAVDPDADMIIALFLPVAGDLADDFGQRGVAGENRAAVAIAAQRF